MRADVAQRPVAELLPVDVARLEGLAWLTGALDQLAYGGEIVQVAPGYRTPQANDASLVEYALHSDSVVVGRLLGAGLGRLGLTVGSPPIKHLAEEAIECSGVASEEVVERITHVYCLPWW